MSDDWNHSGKPQTGMQFTAPTPLKLCFHLKQDHQKPVGELTMNEDGRLEFKGDVEESAQIFFDYLCANFRLPVPKA